jgi:hypothetical protein
MSGMRIKAHGYYHNKMPDPSLRTLEEACILLENEFQYVCDYDAVKILKTKKTYNPRKQPILC